MFSLDAAWDHHMEWNKKNEKENIFIKRFSNIRNLENKILFTAHNQLFTSAKKQKSEISKKSKYLFYKNSML